MTGVQTCALPIFFKPMSPSPPPALGSPPAPHPRTVSSDQAPSLNASAGSRQPCFLNQLALQSILGCASRARTSRPLRRTQHSHTGGLSAACATCLPAPHGGSRDSSRDQAPPRPACRGRPSLLRRFRVTASGRAPLPVTQPPAGARASFPGFCSVLDPTFFCHCGFADSRGWSVP